MPWALDGRDIGVSNWSRTPLTLTLRIRAHATDDYVRELSPEAGGLSTVTFSDGSQETVTGRDSRVVTITPPSRLRPELVEADYTLKSYNESPADGGSLHFDVTLTLQRLETRPFDGGYGEEYGDSYGERYPYLHETPDGYGETAYGDSYGDSPTDVWQFRFEYGSLVLAKGDVVGGEQRARTRTFRLSIPPRRGEVILETLGTIPSVQQVPVPDDDDYYADHHPDDRNTVWIEPPESATDEYLTDGEYAVSNWRVERDPSSRRWAASLTISKVRDTRRAVGQYGGSRWGHFRYGHGD